MVLGACLGALILALGAGGVSLHAGSYNPCQKDGNLTQNCGFDTFGGQSYNGKDVEVPTGWSPFVINGNVEFRSSIDTYWGAPSLWLLSDGSPFCAGVYQQVRVTPGVVYQADAGWAAVTRPDFERKIGLDPSGGTDPQAPNVVWGPAEWGINSWPDLTARARASGSTMTVFVWANHQVTYGNDWIFIDAVGLWPDTSQPVWTVTPAASATPTRRPATATPTAVPPTETPTETPTPPPTDTPTPAPSATPTPTWTPLPSPTPGPPTNTPLPTRTPLPTIVPVPQLVARAGDGGTGDAPAGGVVRSATAEGTDSVFLYVGAAALAGVLLLGGLALLIWLRSRRAAAQDPGES